MKTALVIGIGPQNYNWNKIKGFIQAFQGSGHGVIHWTDSQEINFPVDIMFSEGEPLFIDYSSVKKVVFWTNTDIDKVRIIAQKNKGTDFILAPKSWMFDPHLNQEYIDRWGSSYQVSHFEGQNLKRINQFVNGQPVIQIEQNLKLMYLPCALSSKGTTVKELKYHFGYFGTRNNRPQVVKAVNLLKQKGYSIKVNWAEDRVISPEQCIEFYKETAYVLHEQVHPVMLEYPVRLGEATAHGATVISIESIGLSESVGQWAPQRLKVNSANHLMDTESTLSFDQDRQGQVDGFDFTYDEAIKLF
jgi:hypothetical protein